jgi:hypothetical protein
VIPLGRVSAENWARGALGAYASAMERRTKRSSDRDEALQYLVEALADRSEVDAVLLMNDEGRIVAGMGKPKEVRGLAKIAVPVVRGEPCAAFDEETAGTDFFGRRIPLARGSLYLAALGSRLRKMHEAVYAITRIVEPVQAA